MDRATIDAAALKLFKRHGFDAVKVQDICDACHTTKPTFYHYVASKDDLVLGYYYGACDHAMARLTSAPEDKGCWDQLVYVFEAIFDEMEALGWDSLGHVMALCLSVEEERGNLVRREDLMTSLMKLIEKGQASGEFANPTKSKILYETISQIFQGIEYTWCVRRGNFGWRERFFENVGALLEVQR